MTTNLDQQLFKAADQGNLAELKRLLNLGADPNKTFECQNSPLFRAARNGHFTCLQALIEAGADLHLLNSVSCHALHAVCEQNAPLETLQ